MEYFFQSIRTASYWKYAILSVDAAKTFFAVIGGGWTLIEISDFFHIYERDHFSKMTVVALLMLAGIIVLATRRPINKISYKLPGRDLVIEVRIGSLFKIPGQKIVSTNTTFDTDIAGGIISPNSVQGQFTNYFYPQNIDGLNEHIEAELKDKPFTVIEKEKGKVKKYDLGTCIIFNQGSEQYYWLAMADMNFHNTAETSVDEVMSSLDHLWRFISTQGEMENIVLPLIGTGRGRLTVSRKKLIAQIGQSFVNASESRIFSNKLIIVIRPKDVENFGINLYEVRDLLGNYIG